MEVVEGNVGADDIIRVHGTALEPEGSELALDEYELTVDNRGIITVRSRGVPPMEPCDALRRVRSTTVAPSNGLIRLPQAMRGKMRSPEKAFGQPTG